MVRYEETTFKDTANAILKLNPAAAKQHDMESLIGLMKSMAHDLSGKEDTWISEATFGFIIFSLKCDKFTQSSAYVCGHIVP